jgi:hypothetical protein
MAELDIRLTLRIDLEDYIGDLWTHSLSELVDLSDASVDSLEVV